MTEISSDTLRRHFLGWQCRIRQIAMRDGQGRPSSGMQPRCLSLDGDELASGITVLIVPADSAESTSFFRFQVKKSFDPNQVYERGLTYLQSTYFQKPQTFSDRMTALFNASSATAAALLDAEKCILVFDQYSQRYKILCTVTKLTEDDPHFQATFWHNRMFNPRVPAEIAILGFQPDWVSAQADPWPA